MSEFLNEFIGSDYKALLKNGMLAGMLAGCLIALITVFYCEGWF